MRAVVISHTYVDPAARGKLRALVGLGCTITAAVPARWSPSPRGALLEAAWGDDHGVRIVPFTVTPDRGENARWKGRDLHRLLGEFRPDIVQLEAEPWTPLAAEATVQARRLGLPTVLFASEGLGRQMGLRDRWRERRTLGRLQGLVGGSRLAATRLARGRGTLPVRVIPQLGLTPPLEIVRPDSDEIHIGFVGRLVPEKGLDTLFRACVKLLGRWRVTVVGGGPAQEQLEVLAERLGIASRITWLGALPQERLREIWPVLDCLVVPSRSTSHWVETAHVALVEAMGHGVTVVGTDSGVLPEVIDTAGLLVPENDVEALTAALQHLADAPRERARLGREARLRVMQEYVDDAVARRSLEFWEEVLAH